MQPLWYTVSIILPTYCIKHQALLVSLVLLWKLFRGAYWNSRKLKFKNVLQFVTNYCPEAYLLRQNWHTHTKKIYRVDRLFIGSITCSSRLLLIVT